MEIEYQNKYVVTWCLDREGPRICLRAVTRENQLRTIELVSEDFNIEFEYEEAREFLNILSQLAAAGFVKPVTEYPTYEAPTVKEEPLSEASILPDVIPEVVEPKTPETVLGVAEPEVPEVMPEAVELEIPEAVPEVAEPEVPEVMPEAVEPEIPEAVPEVAEAVTPEVPDSSEIIQILKESERTYSEITPSSLDDDSIEIPSPISHEVEPEMIQEESVVSEPLPIRETSEDLEAKVEMASFFQKSVSKSPLEMLLEEDKKKEEIRDAVEGSLVSENGDEETPEPSSEAKVTYTPDDLITEAFVSKFDTERTMDLLEKPEPESESEFKRVIDLEPAPRFIKKEPTITEVERRAAIEKERAERRRRLWELTRGF